MYIADLHIHSKYSRATSAKGVPEYLELWARKKGISLLGTGDFTHPAWREELKEKLMPGQDGLYTLRKEYQIQDGAAYDMDKPHFVLSGEISSIYKKNGKVRKVHNVILLPSLDKADELSHKLADQFWGWTAGIYWKLHWKHVRRLFLSLHTSGRRIFLCLVHFRGLIRLKNALRI